MPVVYFGFFEATLIDILSSLTFRFKSHGTFGRSFFGCTKILVLFLAMYQLQVPQCFKNNDFLAPLILPACKTALKLH